MARKWWVWFVRYFVLFAMSACVVGFLAGVAIPQAQMPKAANPILALSQMSILVVFGVAAACTMFGGLWCFLVALPVLFVSELLNVIADRRETLREREERVLAPATPPKRVFGEL